MLSTHIVSDLETIASQIVMIRDHRIAACETPMEICEKMRQRVYEVPADTPLGDEDYLLSECQGAYGTMMRIVTKPERAVHIEGARQAEPNLEDAFLYLYRGGME